MKGPECWLSIWSLAGWREPSLMTRLANLVITEGRIVLYRAVRVALQNLSFLKDSINIFWVLVLFYILSRLSLSFTSLQILDPLSPRGS